MQPSKRKPTRTENGLDKRIIAAGVVGCLLLAGIFFGITSSYMKSHNSAPRPGNSAPIPDTDMSNRRGSERSQDSDGQPPLDLKITEHKDAEKPAETPAEQPNSGVKQDDDSLTLTLEPDDGQQKDDAGQDAKPSDTPKQSEPAKAPRRPGRPSAEPARQQPDSDSGARTGSKGSYRIETGTYSNQTNAENIADDLRSKGYRAEIDRVQVEDRTLYRVKAGTYRSRSDAEKAAGDLQSSGYRPNIVGEKGSE